LSSPQKTTPSNVMDKGDQDTIHPTFSERQGDAGMSWPQWSERVVRDQGVLASALSLAHDPDRALEAVHEAVRRTKPACDMGRITHYDLSRSSVRQTAVRTLIDGYRRPKRYSPLPDEAVLPGEEEDREESARADRIALVREVIERLPLEERELIRL